LDSFFIADGTDGEFILAGKNVRDQIESVEVARGSFVRSYQNDVSKRKFFGSCRIGDSAANVNSLRQEKGGEEKNQNECSDLQGL
jgi:hypothetical protein